MSSEDIVERLAAEFAPEHDGQIVLSTTVDADLLRDAKAEIERLRAAGDALVHALDAGDWAKDVMPAVVAWQEARRER